MQCRDSAAFRDYLRSLPSELLESVSEDYVWLSGLDFQRQTAAEFVRRRECCREECARRGVPDVYGMAEREISAKAG